MISPFESLRAFFKAKALDHFDLDTEIRKKLGETPRERYRLIGLQSDR